MWEDENFLNFLFFSLVENVDFRLHSDIYTRLQHSYEHTKYAHFPKKRMYRPDYIKMIIPLIFFHETHHWIQHT